MVSSSARIFLRSARNSWLSAVDTPAVWPSSAPDPYPHVLNLSASEQDVKRRGMCAPAKSVYTLCGGDPY
ncbi:hypothetical protein MFAL_28490 [Mycolicibacterium fallax]|nr:hypothetical protein MFAL_28490 [Mycolicibacterium fallax]